MVLSYTRLSLIDNTLKEYLPYFQVSEQNKTGLAKVDLYCNKRPINKCINLIFYFRCNYVGGYLEK